MAFIEERKSKNGEASFRVRVRVKGFPVQTATFQTKTEAKRWGQKIESNIREGKYFEYANAKRKTMADLIDRYILEILPHKNSCRKDQTSQLEAWKKIIGHMRIEEITSSVIYSARNALQKVPTHQGAMRSNATMNRYMAVLSHSFTVAINQWEWCRDNPCSKIPKLDEGRGRERVLSDDERKRLLDVCYESKSAYLYEIVVLALSTGARKNEILTLKWQNVLFEDERLIFPDTKNGEIRGVPVQALALDILKALYKRRTGDSEFVFPSQKYPNEPTNIKTAWNTALKLANIENFRFHDLRHTAASHLAMNKASHIDLSTILGHKSLDMVKRYSHLSHNYTKGLISTMNEEMFKNRLSRY